MAHPKDIGIRIRQLRDEAGLTQEDLAPLVGVSRGPTVSGWEKGHAIPPADRLRKIAVACGANPEEAFGLWVDDEVREGRDEERHLFMLLDPLPVYHGKPAVHGMAIDEEPIRNEAANAKGNDTGRTGRQSGTEPPAAYRTLLVEMGRVLAAGDIAPEMKLALLTQVASGMRIAGLIAEGELSGERVRSLADERELSRDRQGIIGKEREDGRDRVGRIGGDEGVWTREQIEQEAERIVKEADEAAALEVALNQT